MQEQAEEMLEQKDIECQQIIEQMQTECQAMLEKKQREADNDNANLTHRLPYDSGGDENRQVQKFAGCGGGRSHGRWTDGIGVRTVDKAYDTECVSGQRARN